ncbi:hypothetical protein F5Y16DRAFT_400919 [Xylariaceae sp. FL0255]|nr:hypothetical protein F5Y16DRAFT_400919 [Xylariaceae sp. FL0255]
MASDDQQLTHAEIWDDSALIDSWNVALEEYKKYHSIYRNGGNVNDLLQPKKEETSDAKIDLVEPPASKDHGATVEVKDDESNETREAGTPATQHINLSPRGPGPAPAPEGLLSTVRDEGLKRLLMSWYYAGYYTGYYEGQRDAPQTREVSD